MNDKNYNPSRWRCFFSLILDILLFTSIPIVLFALLNLSISLVLLDSNTFILRVFNILEFILYIFAGFNVVPFIMLVLFKYSLGERLLKMAPVNKFEISRSRNYYFLKFILEWCPGFNIISNIISILLILISGETLLQKIYSGEVIISKGLELYLHKNQEHIKDPQNNQGDVKASILQRFLNRLIDATFILISTLLLLYLSVGLYTEESLGISVFFAWAFSTLIFYFIGEFVFGKSIGKIFTGTTVKTINYQNTSLQPILRLLQFIPLWAIINSLISAFTLLSSGKTLHDKMSGTIVVDDKIFAAKKDDLRYSASNINPFLGVFWKRSLYILVGIISLIVIGHGSMALYENITIPDRNKESISQVAGISEIQDTKDDSYSEKINELEKEVLSLKKDLIEKDSINSESVIAYDTYTNEYFSEFKLVYPDYMEFSTETMKSNFVGLLKITITLKHRNDTARLYIHLSPLDTVKCGEINDYNFKKQIGKFGRYETETFYNYYLVDESCEEMNVIESNISYNDIEGYFVNDKPNIYYRVYIESETDGAQGNAIIDKIIEDSNLITEIDKHTFFVKPSESSSSISLNNNNNSVYYKNSELDWLCNDYIIYTDQWKECMGFDTEPIEWISAGTLCRDGWKSPSTGRGACSHHGGIAR